MSLFYFLSITFAFVIWMSFIEATARLRINLFCYGFCRNIAKLVTFAQFLHCCFNNSLHGPHLLQTKALSDCFCQSHSHRECLIRVKIGKIQKQKFESQFNAINPFSAGSLLENVVQCISPAIRARSIWKLYYN